MLKGKKSLKLAMAGLTAAALAGTVLTGCAPANSGGTLTYLTNSEAWTHADPQRNYTGMPVSYTHLTLPTICSV